VTNIIIIFETSQNKKHKEKKVGDMVYYAPVWKRRWDTPLPNCAHDH